MTVRRSLSLWAPVALYLAAIFVASSTPRIPVTDRVSDKILHGAAYAVLGLLALRATHGGLVDPRPSPAAAAGIFTVLSGITDEIHQAFVPGRNPDPRDVAADAIGFLAAAGVWVLVAALRRVRRGAGRAPL